MGSRYTAVIHLRDPATPVVGAVVEPMLRLSRGVDAVHYEPTESLITVTFDQEQTGLADLVRLIEDEGSVVSSVAQRQVPLARAG